MLEGLAVKLGLVAAAAGLIYSGVKAYGRLQQETGEQKELTDWHNLKFTGALAGIAEQYLRKGSKVYVEGQNKTTKYQDSNGNDKFMHEVVIGIRGQLQMLDSKPEGQQQ